MKKTVLVHGQITIWCVHDMCECVCNLIVVYVSLDIGAGCLCKYVHYVYGLQYSVHAPEALTFCFPKMALVLTALSSPEAGVSRSELSGTDSQIPIIYKYEINMK